MGQSVLGHFGGCLEGISDSQVIFGAYKEFERRCKAIQNISRGFRGVLGGFIGSRVSIRSGGRVSGISMRFKASQGASVCLRRFHISFRVICKHFEDSK